MTRVRPRLPSRRTQGPLVLLVVIVVTLLAACGDDGSGDGDGADGPTEPLTPSYQFTSSVEFDSNADGIDPERVDELLSIREQAGDGEIIEPCPFGEQQAILMGLPMESTPGEDLYGLALTNDDSFFEADPELKCLEGGAEISLSKGDEPESVDHILAAAGSRGFASVSTPVELYGGEAFVYCADDFSECSGVWFDEVGTLFRASSYLSPSEQGSARWLSSLIPVALGDGEAAEAATALDVAETLDLENDSGYSVRAEIAFSVGDITKDPTSSLPGETEVVVPTQGEVTVTNTTDSRETSISILGFAPRGVYDGDSRVCSELVDQPPIAFTEDYCLLGIGSGIDWTLTEEDVLPPDSASTRTTDDSFSGDSSESRFLVEETSADQLIEALRQPVGMVLVSPYDEEFWGSGGDNWLASSGCVIDAENEFESQTLILQLVESSPLDLCG